MAKKQTRLKIIPLGGLGDIGCNVTVLEYGDDIILIDCGMGFPDENMLGVDLVLPDFSYLEGRADCIRAIFLTHGHEDHIGALPYFLRTMQAPIYGGALTLGIVENKLVEHKLERVANLKCIQAGDVVSVGSFSVEAIHVNHSIPDSLAFAIKTPVGTVVHTGDFKIDLTPLDSGMIDLTRFGELGKQGVAAMLCDSTNAERAGYTPSERKVAVSLNHIFAECDKRIVIATFSSNVHRVQQIINTAAKYKRKVAILGRSMVNIVSAARRLGRMNIPDDTLIDIAEIKRFKPEQVTLITTGSQGEPMSALSRMAYGEFKEIKLGSEDMVVISASPIPGNEKTISRIINELLKKQVSVLYDQVAEVHVSGHACQEEIKTLIGLLRPARFFPFHGEYKHLVKNAELAESMGIDRKNIILPEVGNVYEMDKKSVRNTGTVPSGKVLVDGTGVGDVGSVVLRDRRLLSQDGIITVVAAIDIDEQILYSGPDIVSRGFVYVKESDELMEEARTVVTNTVNDCLDDGGVSLATLKNRIREDLSKFIYTKTKRRPMILPIIMDM